MMENALRLQTVGEDSEAEQLYREVLAVAPDTHDALHMLGAINLARGDLVEAEKLIKDALLLRQEYSTIKKNMMLVQDAINARQQRDIRVVCELGLPLLADEILLRAGREHQAPASAVAQPAEVHRGRSGAMHLIADFGDPTGERAWFARRVATLLSARGPMLWSLQEIGDLAPDSRLMPTISSVDRKVPVGGVQILVGIDCDLEGWIEQAAPDRLLVFGLAAPPARYLEQLRYLAANGAPAIELVFRSRAEAARFGRVGPTVAPPIELSPQHVSGRTLQGSRGTSFTMGALVREEGTVRADEDGGLLEALAAGACRLSILAPGQLRYALGGNRAIEFHSRREVPLQVFLARIDAFLHRVPDPWEEGCGLALFGAMARGLPVLCPRDSLYAEYIVHERSGLLYSDQAQVVAWVHRLAGDPMWARAIGKEARTRAVELFDTASLAVGYSALVEHPPMQPNR